MVLTMRRVKKGTRISDLAGSWHMSDEEAGEIAASTRKAWDNFTVNERSRKIISSERQSSRRVKKTKSG